MNLVKSFFLMSCLLVGLTALQAQHTKGKAHKGQHFEQVTAELNLSEEQATEFKAIKKAMRSEMKQLKGSGDRAAMKTVRAKYKTQINTLLSPTQQEKLQALKSERKGKKRGHGQKHMAKMAQQLNLSDAQMAEMKNILSNSVAKRKELRTNEDRAGLKAFRQEQHQAMKAILNPTQLEQWETMKAERKGRKKGKASPEQRTNRQVNRMTEQLNLSTTQTNQIKAIFATYAGQKANTEQTDWKAARKAMKTEINAVLTPAQATQWAALKGQKKRRNK